MAKRKGASATSCSRARKKVDRDAREVENAQRLDSLPLEVWGKIFDELEENDLFPLALSCRYFRQKQKELVERARQRGPGRGKPPLALKTNLMRKVWYFEGPTSAEYLRFCRKEKVPKNVARKRARADQIRYLAAFHGHLPLLQELLKHLKALDIQISRAAARGGQLETLQWLRSQEGFELDTKLFAAACRGGNFEVLKWLRSEGCPWNEWACTGAARGGNFEILKWLRSEGCPWDAGSLGACAGAAEGGHLEILKWLRSEGCPWDEWACWAAAKGGHLDVLKWVRSEGCPWNEWACSYAASGGHLEVLKWLRSEGCPWNEWACSRAAWGGHLDVLKWLRSEGCPWDRYACSMAAKGGHLEVLKWLRSEGCPWTSHTSYCAAVRRHLDVLRWAIDNGCPYKVNKETRSAFKSLGLA